MDLGVTLAGTVLSWSASQGGGRLKMLELRQRLRGGRVDVVSQPRRHREKNLLD